MAYRKCLGVFKNIYTVYMSVYEAFYRNKMLKVS